MATRLSRAGLPFFQAAPYRYRLGPAAYERDPLVRDLFALIHGVAQVRIAASVDIPGRRLISDGIFKSRRIGLQREPAWHS